MRSIHSIMIPLLFVLLGSNCKTSGQSNSLTSDELRQIANALNEHDFLVIQDSLNVLLLNHYQNIIDDFKAKEILFAIKERSYKNIIDSNKPAWYDNFLTGSSTTTLLFILFIYLIRSSQ